MIRLANSARAAVYQNECTPPLVRELPFVYKPALNWSEGLIRGACLERSDGATWKLAGISLKKSPDSRRRAWAAADGRRH